MSILAAAGGAAKGLDDVLLRMLRQQQMEEQARSNRAQEEHATKSLEETSALRRATQEATAFSQGESRRIQEESRKAAQQGQMRDDIRASLDDLMPGVMITPETRNRAVESGAAVPERFKPQVMPEDFVGPIQEGEPQRGEVASYLLEGQDKAAAQTPANAQVQTVSYQGKPVEAIFDPRARTFTYRGKDITNEVGHYERPFASEARGWAPLIVQSPDGLMVTSPDRSKLTPLAGANGQTAPLPPTSATRDRMAATARIQPVLSKISDLSERINVLHGPVAKGVGGIRRLESMANLDDDTAEYLAVIKGFTPMVARAVGHVGVLTQQDVESVYAMFPSPGDSKSLRDRKIATLTSLISSISGADGGQQSEAPPSGEGFRVLSSRPKQ